MTYLLLLVPIILLIGIILAVKRQAKITQSPTPADQEQDARVFAESAKAVEATAAEALAAKARDPLLAVMTQEDLVYEVLKDCYDPEIPLNVVDLGLIYEVRVHPNKVNVKLGLTSPACPSGAAIAENIKSQLEIAGFPNPKVQIVMEPAWSPQRISAAGRKALGI